MAYEVATGAVLETVINARYAGQMCLTVMHHRLLTDNALDGINLINGFLGKLDGAGGMFEKLCQATVTDYKIINTSAQWIFPLRYARRVGVPVNNKEGTLTGIGLPSSSAVGITRASDQFTGRHAHGTLHMVGAAQADTQQASSLLNATGLSHWNAFANETVEEVVIDIISSFTPIVYNRVAPADSIPVQEFRTSDTIRTMKRRVVGRGI